MPARSVMPSDESEIGVSPPEPVARLATFEAGKGRAARPAWASCRAWRLVIRLARRRY